MCMELVTEAADKREDMRRAPTTSLTIRISGRGAWESALLTPDDSNIHTSLRTTALKGNLIDPLFIKALALLSSFGAASSCKKQFSEKM